MTRRNLILRVLKRNFSMSPIEIGREIGFPYNLTSAKVCNTLKALVKKNWVVKEKFHGRSVYRITEDGKHYINSVDQEL